jgi:hypothetical protein
MNRFFLCVVAVFLFTVKAYTQGAPSAALTLTNGQTEAYKQEALHRIMDLKTYIRQLISNNPDDRRNAAILAVDLFQSPDKNIVELSSVNSSKVSKRPTVRKYFTNLQLLGTRYSEINIQWYKIYFTTDFVKGTDGNYYGTARFLQKFIAKKRGSDGPDSQIEQINDKTIQLILTPKKNDSTKLLLKLGDIRIVEREKH